MEVQLEGHAPSVRQWRQKASPRLAVAVALILPGPALAAEELGGTFVAHSACEAFQSKNRRTNPGQVMTEPGRSYAMTAVNAPGGDYFQIVVPEAPVTTARWVQASCGTAEAEPAGGAAGESTENVLALNWLPAFCETRPSARECRRAAPSRLSVHGLWPQPEGQTYCGVPADLVVLDEAGRWRDLPPVELTPATRDRLRAAMPGTASFLDRHEWLKHGTCHGGGPEAYFTDLLWIADAVNASAVGDLFADRTGEEVDARTIRAAFDAAFGSGAGSRVEMHCVDDGPRTLISELTIGLDGTIAPGADPGRLIRAARRVPAGCAAGLIDPAGPQGADSR
ncbi:MAG: hypothetical protein U1E59_05515 [Amaricoccus sp.]